ncbi:HDOD domain-containing protein [Alishewanella tabrizica]|uniref:HDOD domain-containing protein n=1 Tax=Alishewanella tabrizica TaxID=671278 RepID=A0ABQ2WLB4_9ALTE|nr:HDOD domain-containing protein [Alishewanella tabrizica]GGW57528.1 hypothetical protein GCM10008111_12000 [Alishewanella tabrizica]
MNALQYAQNVIELFSLPDSYFRVRELMESETADLDDIAEVILLDPVLTSKLLKLANSAVYRLPYQVENVSKALLVLGKTQVYNLILSIGISSACSQLNTESIDLDRFWEQSVNAALIAKYLATQLGLKSADRVYVSGLLHNIGELVVAQQNPDIAANAQAYTPEIMPWQLQQTLLGFSYAACGAELLYLWQLPDLIVEPIALQHNLQYHARALEELVVHLAVRLALANQHPELYSMKSVADPALLELLQLEQSDLIKAIDFCNTEGLFVLSVLNPRISTIY